MARTSMAFCRELSRRCRRFWALAPKLEGEAPAVEFPLSRVNLNGSYGGKVAGYVRAAIRSWPKYRPDTVLAFTWSPCGVAARVCSGIFRAPYMVFAHGLDILEPLRSWKFRILMKRVLGDAQMVLPNSQFTARELLRLGLPQRKIVVLPPGLDLSRFGDPVDTAPVLEKYGLRGRRIILTAGRLVDRKGQHLVLRALPAVLQHFPDAIYCMVGDGPARERLRSLAADLGVLERVVFAGHVPEEDLCRFYSACDIFTMPSLPLRDQGEVEGFGMVYLEANAYGKPVVGARGGGAEDAIVDGETGLLVEPGEVGVLADALLKLLREPSLAREMGERGRRRVAQFDWPRLADRLVEILERGCEIS
ncbi:MAG: glycosyltransferase [Acidobacteria bacterium]|nr:glycosyltransferase [Acidobacteriota bacterium]